ncbi:hypothetical protein [Kitasatospora purpeofusca]|uniref:hypothetical protein n=1 Tax=Kitasatospora purpeofusca TaxID=67352 RepID=UPI0038265F79
MLSNDETRRVSTAGCQFGPGGAATSVPGTTPDGHAPGQWPAELQELKADREAATARTRAEIRHRFHTALAAVRVILDDQPTPRTVRTAGRHICMAVTFLADDIARAKAEERDR